MYHLVQIYDLDSSYTERLVHLILILKHFSYESTERSRILRVFRYCGNRAECYGFRFFNTRLLENYTRQ